MVDDTESAQSPARRLPVLSEEQVNSLVSSSQVMWQIRTLENERRNSARAAWSVPARITTADEQAQPVGESRDATLCDISEGGLALITGEPPRSPCLNVDIRCQEKESVSVTIRVIYCIPSENAYRVGGSFYWPEVE